MNQRPTMTVERTGGPLDDRTRPNRLEVRSAAATSPMPQRMRILFITDEQHLGASLAESLAADPSTVVILERAIGVANGLARLRDDAFDAVLVAQNQSQSALEIVDAIQAGTSTGQPVIMIGRQPVEQMEPYCFESNADGYVCLGTATTRSLIWRLTKAIERHRLIVENERLSQQQRQRMATEKVEADRLLSQQRELVGLTKPGGQADPGIWKPPQKLFQHYCELLKTSVVMGWGHVNEEASRFTQVLTSAGVSGNHFMALHVLAVDATVAELGTRGSKHVLNRADLLAMEVLMRLCESYRQGILDSL